MQITNHLKVLVFKSNLIAEEDVLSVKPIMDDHPHVLRWNVDRHDVDNILRVETTCLKPEDVQALLVEAGYHCEELPD